MTEQDKQRIEKEANEYATSIGNTDGTALFDYKRGATAEHERMAELLKEERNKAIDECIEALKVYGFGGHNKMMILENLKSQ